MIKFTKCYLTVKKTGVLNLQKKVCLTYTVTTHNKYRFRIEEVKWKIKIDSSKNVKRWLWAIKGVRWREGDTSPSNCLGDDTWRNFGFSFTYLQNI